MHGRVLLVVEPQLAEDAAVVVLDHRAERLVGHGLHRRGGGAVLVGGRLQPEHVAVDAVSAAVAAVDGGGGIGGRGGLVRLVRLRRDRGVAAVTGVVGEPEIDGIRMLISFFWSFD